MLFIKENSYPNQEGRKMIHHCIECSQPVNPLTFGFEQKLIMADAWCSKCWNRLMSEADLNVSHLDNPRYLALTA